MLSIPSHLFWNLSLVYGLDPCYARTRAPRHVSTHLYVSLVRARYALSIDLCMYVVPSVNLEGTNQLFSIFSFIRVALCYKLKEYK